MKHCIVFILAALLHGCAAPGGGFMNANMQMDAGSRPSDPETAIRSYLNGALKDPGSLTNFSVGEPVLSSCAIGIYGNFHGWRVPAQYNAKNSFGGYVGTKVAYFWFHGDQLKGVGDNPGFCPEATIWRSAVTPVAAAPAAAPTPRKSADDDSRTKLLNELAADKSISYEEYQRRYKIIMRQP